MAESLKPGRFENRLDERHPDGPFVSDNSVPEFGTLAAVDGQVLHYRLFAANSAPSK
jgi:dipeptidyl-peptidase-4